MGRTTGLLLTFLKCNATANEADWARWYDDEHLPDLLQGPDAPWVATRWELTEKPVLGMPGIGFPYVTIYEFDGDAPHKLAALYERDRELRAKGRIHANHTVLDAQSFSAHSKFRDKPEPSAALKGHIIAWVLSNQPEHEAEWDEWYDREHVPDMLDSGGFAAATRWQRNPRVPYGPNHITLYDVHHESVQTAVDLSAAAMGPLIAAGRKHRCHTGGLTITVKPTGRHGGAGLRASEV